MGDDLTDFLCCLAQGAVAAASDHPVGEHFLAADRKDRQGVEPPVLSELWSAKK